MAHTRLIASLRESDQDFEFYPTTQQIISAMLADMREMGCHGRDYRHDRLNSVLDIGAGNGKVLEALGASDLGFKELYAIEKSEILRQQLPASVFIVGTEFMQQSLLSKSVAITFCNPPYSEFETWAAKIIRESASNLVYLVIPVRWSKSSRITEALAYREVKAEIVGTYSFAEAEDRQARAEVHLLRIELGSDRDDSFERFFNEQFAAFREKFDAPAEKEDSQSKVKFQQLVVGESYPEAMVGLYVAELAKIQRNYELVGELDVSLLREFGVTPEAAMACLKTRLSGLKSLYWKEIFDRMSAITDRLTSKKRQKLLESLNRHANVDFTVDNIFAVILWVIKNANEHLDTQLIEVFERMVEKANVYNYVSNTRAFVNDRWRYVEEADKPSHYALEFRLVLERVGGVYNEKDSMTFQRGLVDSAAEFMGDMLTVARNLGFHCTTNDVRVTSGTKEWKAGELVIFTCTDREGKEVTLFEARAFKNGNIHMRMHPKLALALNVEYGRLKGWLKSGPEAATELKDPEAAAMFRTNLALPTTGNPTLMLVA